MIKIVKAVSFFFVELNMKLAPRVLTPVSSIRILFDFVSETSFEWRENHEIWTLEEICRPPNAVKIQILEIPFRIHASWGNNRSENAKNNTFNILQKYLYELTSLCKVNFWKTDLKIQEFKNFCPIPIQ